MNQRLLAAGFGAVLLLGLPALAQTRPDTSSPAAVGEHARQQGGSSAAPAPFGTGAMADAARRAEQSAASRDAEALLGSAEEALRRGSRALANEYLERAETSLLNRHATPGQGSPQAGMREGQALRAVSEARGALTRRDRPAAMSAIQAARSEVRQISQADSTTGGTMRHGN